MFTKDIFKRWATDEEVQEKLSAKEKMKRGLYNSKLDPVGKADACLLYTSPSPRDGLLSRMPSSA